MRKAVLAYFDFRDWKYLGICEVVVVVAIVGNGYLAVAAVSFDVLLSVE